MSSSQAFQQFTIYRQWDAYTTLGIGHRGNTINLRGICRNAAGNACGWKIEGEQFKRVRAILQQMEAEPLSRAAHYLQDLASVAVCQWHTDQQWTVITEWERILGNATGELAAQESLEVKLHREREKLQIMANRIEELEAKIRNTSSSVSEFGTGGGGKLPENLTVKQDPEFEHGILKLAEKAKATLTDERDAALEQAAALKSKNSEELETLQNKMESKLSLKDKEIGKLENKLEEAGNNLGEKNKALSVLQRQLDEVEGVRANLVQEKHDLEEELRKQNSIQEKRMKSLQDDLLRHQDLLSQTLAASENSKTKKPYHSEVKGTHLRNPQEFKEGEKGFWRNLAFRMTGFGKKNKLPSHIKQGKQTEFAIHELEK